MTTRLHNVAIYGVGHFGYAVLLHLQEKLSGEFRLRAFDRNDEVRAHLRSERRHPYHDAGAPLDARVQIVDSPDALMDGVDGLILAVTSDSTREVLGQIESVGWDGRLMVVNTAKAIDFQTGRRLSEITAEALAGRAMRYVALSGGTIASELILQHPLGMTVASEDEDALVTIKALFSSPNLWVETSTDLAGVEYAGAFKNVIAICAGIVRGMERSHGAVTHLISRLALEVEGFCVRRLGARRETFSIGSQCWGSDLWMSCMGPTRNSAFGELLGKGQTLDEALAVLASAHKSVEGLQTLRAITPLMQRYPGELRLIEATRRVVLEGEPSRLLLEALMQSEV